MLHRANRSLLPPPRPRQSRVNSSEALAAAEHLHSPALGGGRGSLFAGSPREGIELVVAAGGAGGKSGGGTPSHPGSVVLAKKHTPAAAGGSVETTALLLDRSADEASAGGGTRVHLRASHTSGGAGGSGVGTPNGALSPMAAARARLGSAL